MALPTTSVLPLCANTTEVHSERKIVEASMAKKAGSSTGDDSTPSRRGRFMLELVEKDEHDQHAEHLIVTHANCDPSLSPVPSSSIMVLPPQPTQPKKTVTRRVGRFVVEDVEDSPPQSEPSRAATDSLILPRHRRIGRFEVISHERSGAVTPTLLVYPVLERTTVPIEEEDATAAVGLHYQQQASSHI